MPIQTATIAEVYIPLRPNTPMGRVLTAYRDAESAEESPTLQGIADRLRMSRANVLHHCRTLIDLGLMDRTEDRRYVVAPLVERRVLTIAEFEGGDDV